MTDAGESVNKDVKEPCPQVFVVDSQAFPRQVPIKLDIPRLTLVYLLLAVALVGVFIEAGFICHLYSRQAVSSDVQKAEFIKGEDVFPSAHDYNDILPEKKPKAESTPAAKAEDKPAAFLQSDSPVSKGNGILLWRSVGYPMFKKGLDYKNNSLYVQQDGYYYIFSKISHLENCKFFQHKVMQRSEIYSNKPIELMQNSRYLQCSSNKPHPTGERGNSYLGGVFHLNKGDSVFVTVNNSSLVNNNAYENFFGAFMV